jgi:glyoxylase-like metal-dependent hydrolase (beta-lactamase superfamily II)
VLIRTAVVTPFAQNARVLVDESSAEALVIDPGGDVARIEELSVVDGQPLRVRQIFLTHSHLDHVGGVTALRERIRERSGEQPLLLGHRAEKNFREHIRDMALMFGLPPEQYPNAPEPDRYVDEGDEIVFGNLRGRLLFTPGHSPGHLALFFEKGPVRIEPWPEQPKELRLDCPLLVGGDLLFAGSIGRTDLPGGDGPTLLRSVREKVFPLPSDTRILTGHGPDTEVGVEQRTNPFFQ